MASFTDATGRAWPVAFTIGQLAPLKALGFDVGGYVRGDLEAVFGLDPAVLVRVLQLVCVSPDSGELITDDPTRFEGDTVVHATVAVAKSLVEFMPLAADSRGIEFLNVEGLTAEELGLDLERECWELAGVVGIDPRPFSYRELYRMWVGRERAEWDRAAVLMSFLSARLTPLADGVPAAKLSPFRSTKPLPTAEQRERRSAEMFRRLEAGLANLEG